MLLVVLLPILFLIGVARLFQLRFETGDVYPVYSSLRSDPLGTRALFEGLNRLEGIVAERNYRNPAEIDSGAGATFFFPGYLLRGEPNLSPTLIEEIERIARTGGRVVLTFHPEIATPEQKKRRNSDRRKAEADPASEPHASGRERGRKEVVEEAAKHSKGTCTPVDGFQNPIFWDIALKYAESPPAGPARCTAPPDGALPSSLPLHTTLYFEIFKSEWTPVYMSEDHPVLIERSFGRGTVVLSADTYFLSNEAMLRNRGTPLLVWLMGNNTRAVFSETHLGIQARPGITHLVRKYDLHRLVWVILLLAGLFVWKNSIPFVPPAADPSAPDHENSLASRRDYTEGLVHLLRRHIPRGDLLRVCWEEWEKSAFDPKARPTAPMIDSRRRILESFSSEAIGSDPVAGYRRIHRMLSEAGSISRKA